MGKPIMFQGTGSSVGKSLISMGICKYLSDKGYSVYPFKSQNMSSNSVVLSDNREMGVAQYLQALACNKKPNPNMNPILLKPTSDKKSDVLFLGKYLERKNAYNYYKEKSKYIGKIKNIYSEIEKSSDVVVIEGAGSPAEINLLENDFVNTGMAQMAKSPVILIGDIDKGGVFASLYGTIKILPEELQKYYKGIIINKFRGDVEILKPGIAQIENMLGIPVLGVLPMMDVNIEDEDSLTEKYNNIEFEDNKVNIGILKLKNIVNYSSIEALDDYSVINLSFIDLQDSLPEKIDVLIIPQTKNIEEDISKLKENNWDKKIKLAESKGIRIIGICEGFELLCNQISYSQKSKDSFQGLSVIDAKVTKSENFVKENISIETCDFKDVYSYLNNQQYSGYKNSNTEKIEGYEINSSNFGDSFVFLQYKRILGIYMNNVFSNFNFINQLIKPILIEKGIDFSINDNQNYFSFFSKELNKLTSTIEENLDMDLLIKIINEGI